MNKAVTKFLTATLVAAASAVLVAPNIAGAAAALPVATVTLLAAAPAANTAVLAVGDAMYFRYQCLSCYGEQSGSPLITVSDVNGTALTGTLEAVDVLDGSPDPSSEYVIWKPASPLIAGEYQVKIAKGTLADFWEGDLQYTLTVEGAQQDAPTTTFEWELSSHTAGAGTDIGCEFSCYSHGCNDPFTQRQTLPVLVGSVSTPPRASDLGAFLYRFSWGEDSSTGWISATEVSAQFSKHSAEECVKGEYVRLRDHSVVALGTTCLPNTLGGLHTEPAMFNDTCGPGSLEDIAFTTAWCKDNASFCLGTDADDFEGCVDYASHCGELASGGAGGTGSAGGAAGSAVIAGDTVGNGASGSGASDEHDDADAGKGSLASPNTDSDSCSVARVAGARSIAPSGLLMLLVLGLLLRRRSGRA